MMNYSTFEEFASLKNAKPLYHRQERQGNIENEQYKVPLLLCQPYREVEVKEQRLVQVYHHELEYAVNRCSIELGFITSAKVEALESVEFSYHKNDELTIVHEKVGVKVASEETFLTAEDFELVLRFNQYLQADWYKMAHKHVEKSMEGVESYLKEELFEFEGMRRRYLFTLRKGEELDWERMEQLVEEKRGVAKHSLMKEYLEMEGAEFRAYCERHILRSLQHHTTYNVYHVLDNIWKRTVEEYFALMAEFTPEWSVEQVVQYYGIQEHEYLELKDKKLGHLLYEYHFANKIESIYGLRSAFDKLKGTKDEFKQNVPVALGQYTRSIKSLQFFRREQYESIGCQDQNATFESSCRQKLSLKKPQMQLIPISTLCAYALDVQEYDQTLTLPMVMLDVERQVVAQELLLQLGLRAPMKHIMSATQTAGYSVAENYEVLETVGDSILKYFATLMVYYNQGHFNNEHQLSEKRNEFVANKLLFHVSYQNRLDLYLRTHFYCYQDWITPVLNKVLQNDPPFELFAKTKSQLAMKTMADLYEAVLGAIYMNNYSLHECYEYLRQTRHPLTDTRKSLSHKKYLHSNLCLDHIFTQFVQFNQQASFKDLCTNLIQLTPDTILNIKNSIQNFIETGDDNQFFLEYLQEHILSYKFDNLSILIQALTMKPYNSEAYAKFAQHKQLLHNLNPTLFHNSIFYGAFSFQNLEFLGDAVLETLIVTNAYIIFQKHNKQIVPDTLQKVKIALLANPFMARQSLANAFHHFIINHDADYTSYEETLHLTTPFKLYQTNLATLPKTLSDIWESICGAILIDGGWDAVIRTFGKIYQPYLNYICTYIDDIEDHVITKVQQYCTQHFKSFEFTFDRDNCHIIHQKQILATGTGENERQAKENCAIDFCQKYDI